MNVQPITIETYIAFMKAHLDAFAKWHHTNTHKPKNFSAEQNPETWQNLYVLFTQELNAGNLTLDQIDNESSPNHKPAARHRRRIITPPGYDADAEAGGRN